jgi:hypothetical protein
MKVLKFKGVALSMTPCGHALQKMIVRFKHDMGGDFRHTSKNFEGGLSKKNLEKKKYRTRKGHQSTGD